MALIKCSDCGTEASAQAKFCSKCGRPIPKRPVPKRSNVLAVLLALLIVGPCLLCVFTPSKPKTPEEKRLGGQFSSWDGSHYGLTRHIKEHMNDPSTYEHIDTTYADKGNHLIVETKWQTPLAPKSSTGAVSRLT